MDHTIIHFEIPAEDVSKLRQFYSELFGWKIDRVPGPVEYYVIETVPVDEKMMPIRAGVNGGMYKKDELGAKPVNYISVESIDDYVEKLKALGGMIIRSKEEVTGVGWVALALDPEGNQFAMLQPIQV